MATFSGDASRFRCVLHARILLAPPIGMRGNTPHPALDAHAFPSVGLGPHQNQIRACDLQVVLKKRYLLLLRPGLLHCLCTALGIPSRSVGKVV